MIKFLFVPAAFFAVATPCLAATKNGVDWTFMPKFNLETCEIDYNDVPCDIFLDSYEEAYAEGPFPTFGAKFTGVPKGQFPRMSIDFQPSGDDGDWIEGELYDGDWLYCGNLGCGIWGGESSVANFTAVGVFISTYNIGYRYTDEYTFFGNNVGENVRLDISNIFGGSLDRRFSFSGNRFDFSNDLGDYATGRVEWTITNSDKTAAAVPVPPSLALLPLGILALSSLRRGRRRLAAADAAA